MQTSGMPSRVLRSPSPSDTSSHVNMDDANNAKPPPTNGAANDTAGTNKRVKTTNGTVTANDDNLSNQRPLPSPPAPGGSLPTQSGSDTEIKDEHKRGHGHEHSDDDELKADHADRPDHTALGEEAHEASNSSGNEAAADKVKGKPKKKAMKFYCTEFPPCDLMFTRSEHLARHIRKHTGERPFVCHCGRRFSRLDNLRQHAQTVHSQEQIPADSLAAGSRYARPVRPERAPRPRGGANGGPIRGHGKALSMSNISTMPVASGPPPPLYPPHESSRQRPPPLATVDPRARQQPPFRPAGTDFRPVTPTEFNSPISATFSNGPSSPRWSSHGASPSLPHARPRSMYATTGGIADGGRRLSIASSEGLGVFGSPTAAGAAPFHVRSDRRDGTDDPMSPDMAHGWARRNSLKSIADEATRRQTWHMGLRDNASGRAALLPSSVSANNVVGYDNHRPTLPPPVAGSSVQGSQMRLPGIDSFLSPRPATPPLRSSSPMAMDIDRAPAGPVQYAAPEAAMRAHAFGQSMDSHTRRASEHWDTHLNHNLNRLDISGQTPPKDSAGAWMQAQGQAQAQAQAQAEQAAAARLEQRRSIRFEPGVRSPPSVYATDDYPQARPEFTRGHHYTQSAPVLHEAKRQRRRAAFFNGPQESSSRGERMVHPNLVNGFAGFPGRNVPQTVHEHPPSQHSEQPPYEAPYERSSYERAYERPYERPYQQQRQQPQPQQPQQQYQQYQASYPHEQNRQAVPPPHYGHGQLYASEKHEVERPAGGHRSFNALDALVAVATGQVTNDGRPGQ